MKLNIGVIFGGATVEHEISIISASQVIKALNSDKYEVIPIYISKDQNFYFYNGYKDISVFKDLKEAVSLGTEIVFKKVGANIEMHKSKNSLFSTKIYPIDIFFPVMHGTNGEDGTLQGMLEMLGAAFTGPDTRGAVNGQDKIFMKNVLRDNKVKVVDFEWFYDNEYFEDEQAIITKIENKIVYPMIIKPATLGSSIGIGKAKNREELIIAINEALQYDNKIIVERVIENLCEVNCAVLGDYSFAQASAIEEVFQSEDILSYQDKYQSKGGKTKGEGMARANRVIPAQLGEDLTNKVKAMAIKGFKVLNLAGNTRIDFLIDKNTNEVYLNEVNTIPGSLAFYLWKEIGLEFDQLCDEMIKLAIKRKREESKHITTFDTSVLENFEGSKTGKK